MTARGRRRLVVVAVLGLLAAVGPSALGAGLSAAGAQVQADRVLIVSYPRLTWALVEEVDPPVLGELLRGAAVASMSVQTAAATTTTADGYLTLGAGNRARGLSSPEPYLAPHDDGAGVVVPEIDALRARNDDLRYDAEPGLLGQALATAGTPAAVIANADVVGEEHRDAALAVMDEQGQAGGTVAPSLAVDDPSAPGGRRLDPAAVQRAFADAWVPGAVVLVEMSDLDRADRAGSRGELAEAVRQADDLLDRLLDAVDRTRDLVLIVAPAAPGDAAELTVFAMTGPGVAAGGARSATTRQDGYVTLPDVAPTVLAARGVDVPDAMTGTVITPTGGGTVDPSLRADRDARSSFRERAAVPVTVTFLVLQLVVYVLGAAALRRRTDADDGDDDGRRRPVPEPLVRAGLLAVLAFPALTFASGAFGYDGLGLGGYLAALVLGSLVVGAAVTAAFARTGPGLGWSGAWILIAATWLLLVIDAVRGGALQLDTPFGYSPITAARFAGMGNVGLALVLAAALVTAAGSWLVQRGTAPALDVDADARTRRAPRSVLVVAAVVFVITVVVDAAPTFGADFGGLLALVPGLGVGWLVLAGRRITWAKVVVVGLVTVALAALVAVIDLARPEEDRTHIGRFAARLLDGEAGTILARKAATNLAVLAHPGVLLVIALAAVAAVIAWRSPTFAEVRRRVPGVQATVLGGAVGGVLGLAVNDSGVVVPGIMLAVLVPWFACLALDLDTDAPYVATLGGGRVAP